VAGKAGGTVIVIKSRDLSISPLVSTPNFINYGNVAKKPPTPITAIAPTKIRESL